MDYTARCLRTLIGIVIMILLVPTNVWSKDFTPDIRPGVGVTEQRKISHYFAPLKDSNLDTDVFILDSGKPGATALLIGGTHGNELAGQVAALIMVENAMLKSGKLFVIPQINRSALSMKDSRKHIKQKHLIKSRSGERYLYYGDRRTDPQDQGGNDPDSYKNPVGYKLKNGAESRNLNRTYPGNPQGTMTEKLAYAIMNLIRQEKIDFSLDMHEADTPEKYTTGDGKYSAGRNKRLAYTLVAHPNGLEMGAYALLSMEEDTNISMKLEQSNAKFRGISHLEMGTETGNLSFLSESPNPGQDRWRTNPDVISDEKYPLTHRVAMHLRLFKHLADNYAELNGEDIEINGLPQYKELMNGDIGQFLN